MDNILTRVAAMKINTLEKDDFGDDGSDVNLGATIGRIIQAVVGMLGLACVVIIIIGGINYMTSSGDAGKVKKAKDTILYGVIGMVICVLAFAITTFIINSINAPGVAGGAGASGASAGASKGAGN